ncbi:Intraflagellar transport complex B protein 46 C terminal [Phytophthora infestans]|uniref:Intraflagellar transport complex B protein 46 C terminal n=1 Tax=Phytophthora infestans TaxID=4787 RepID=A0A8S9V0V7_PHYIN|nr:Intraflagellar transport complex B protein 46 C terminal [Phytophthora infestans]
MSDSDEEKVLLDDESMDEVHELDDEMQVSVDTTASSPLNRSRGRSSDSEDSSDANVSSDSSSEEDFVDLLGAHGGDSMGGFGRDEGLDEDSDEPPEIPGSPIAQKLQIRGVTPADFGAIPINSRIPPDKLDTKAAGKFGEVEDEYEAKEVEQSRAVEFYASSSSEDDESDDGTDRTARDRNNFALEVERSVLGRPKTAAKDLEKYRGVVPNDFFQQAQVAARVNNADFTPSANAPSPRPAISSKKSVRRSTASNGGTQQQYFKLNLEMPRELEELFSVSGLLAALTDAYTPLDIEIETRLEPFLPEFTPSVGLPFDGILIPRPDDKEDNTGFDILREPSGQTNVAELELLMQVSVANRNKPRSRREVVRSIENASHRPQELEQWITSVEKIQGTKPLAQVNYRQPMPPLSQLMELWPEELEDYLAARGDAFPALSELELSFKELVKIVCAVLDIPVYEDNYVQSLHVLFSLYLEFEAYERDAQGLQR